MLDAWVLSLALCQTGPAFDPPPVATSYLASGRKLET